MGLGLCVTCLFVVSFFLHFPVGGAAFQVKLENFQTLRILAILEAEGLAKSIQAQTKHVPERVSLCNCP